MAIQQHTKLHKIIIVIYYHVWIPRDKINLVHDTRIDKKVVAICNKI